MRLYYLLLLELITTVYLYSIYGYTVNHFTLNLLCLNISLFTVYRLIQMVGLYILNNYTVILENTITLKALSIYSIVIIISIINNIFQVI